jgi:hypothetical protein
MRKSSGRHSSLASLQHVEDASITIVDCEVTLLRSLDAMLHDELTLIGLDALQELRGHLEEGG